MSERGEEALQEFVLSTLASVCNVQRHALSEETSLFDLGLDSVTLAGVVAQVEMHYACDIPIDQVYELFDAPLVRDVVSILSRFANGSPGSAE